MPNWREILGRDGPAAWRTAFRILGNRADADECFQEACLAALEEGERGECVKSNFSAGDSPAQIEDHLVGRI